MKTIPPKVRFWKFVDVRGDDDCWLWTGTLVKQDYGRFYLAAGKPIGAHRFSWEISNGRSVPKGMCICHTCDNPKCVNPKHLWLGTNEENTADRHAKGRSATQSREHYQRAQAISARTRRRFTDRQIREIRWSGQTQKAISDEYGVSRQLIGLIKRGEVYADV